MNSDHRWWATPLRVALPWSLPELAEHRVAVPAGPARRVARTSARVIPWVLVVAGSAIAVIAGVVIDRELNDAAGGLGIELGAALWFAGVLTLGARRGATLGRAVALAGLAAAGAALVVVAFVGEWTGAALDLALEFGVGAVSVAVIDVVLIGVLHSRLQQLGDAQTSSAILVFGRRFPWVSLESPRQTS